MARRRHPAWRRTLAGLLLALASFLAVTELLARLRLGRIRRAAGREGLLHIEERGRGDPAVFLAGIAASTRYWGRAFDPLAADRRLLFVDPLGFGRSPWPDAEYTLEEHLGALERTLSAHGAGRRLTLVGHSLGALLAAHYAARNPGEVERLVLLGTPVFADEGEARRRIRAMSHTGGMFTLNPLVGREVCRLHEAYAPLLAPLLPRLAPDLPPEVARDAVLHTWRSYRGTLENVVLGAPVAPALAGLGRRTTFVHGRRDGVTPLATIEALARKIGARVVVTDDDHLSYSFREPAAILRVLREPE